MQAIILFKIYYDRENDTIQVEFDCEIKNKKEKIKYIIQKSDGSTLYITRDIAALIDRKMKYRFSKIVYVVGKSVNLGKSILQSTYNMF